MPPEGGTAHRTGPYTGWIAGALAILAILAAGAVLWFMYHPL